MTGIKKEKMLVTRLKGRLTKGAPIIVMSISGGKDSLAMWLLLWSRGVKNLVPVHYRSEWDWPCGRDEIERVEKITGIKCHVMDCQGRFDAILEKRGWPTWGVRWCAGEKRDKLKVFLNSVKRGQPGYKVLYAIGVAANELQRMKQDWIKREAAWMPLVEWGVNESEALKICARHGCLWGGHYMRRGRLSCWCCPRQKIGDLREIYFYNPKLWDELKRKDTISPGKRKFKWNKKGIPELERRFAKEKKDGIF